MCLAWSERIQSKIAASQWTETAVAVEEMAAAIGSVAVARAAVAAASAVVDSVVAVGWTLAVADIM